MKEFTLVTQVAKCLIALIFDSAFIVNNSVTYQQTVSLSLKVKTKYVCFAVLHTQQKTVPSNTIKANTGVSIVLIQTTMLSSKTAIPIILAQTFAP